MEHVMRLFKNFNKKIKDEKVKFYGKMQMNTGLDSCNCCKNKKKLWSFVYYFLAKRIYDCNN